MSSTPLHLPPFQKSLLFNTTTSTLHLDSTSPVPTPNPTTHILKVHSTAITSRELTWAPFTNWPALHVPCYDVSGTILSSVPGSPFSPGDKVFGRVDAFREGTAREYAEILPSEAAVVPRGVSMLDAAAVPMSALTAWQALFEKGLLTGEYGETSVPRIGEEGGVLGGELAKGKRVLVLNAAGGVGIQAVQFARLAGAEVVGTTSGRNAEFVKGLGAEVVDYTGTTMREWVRGEESRKFDLVFDCVGGDAMLGGWDAVKEGGVYVSVVPGFKEPEGGKPKGARSEWFVMESRGEELGRIGKFYERGLVKGWVDSVWSIEQFEEAFKKTATGRARGKVVIKIAEEDV